MKFVFIGYDYSLDIAIRLMEEGHELTHIFTFPCDNIFSFNTQIADFAKMHNIPITEEKITVDDINTCLAQGVQLFLSVGYPYKIPNINETKAYAINMHPTLLPKAKGVMPLPYVILEEPDAAGLTFHKTISDIDGGDIIYQHPIPINEQTDVETLSAQIAIHSHNIIPDIVNNIQDYWKNATPQDQTESSTVTRPDENYRTINWNDNCETLNKQSKAFGRYGTIAHVTNNIGQTQKLAVYQFSTWQDHHKHKAGTLLRSSPREIIIAIKDGYACLKDFRPVE